MYSQIFQRIQNYGLCWLSDWDFHLKFKWQYKARSHLATATHIFDIVTISSEMGCMVTNVTVHTWRQKKDIIVARCEWALSKLLWVVKSVPWFEVDLCIWGQDTSAISLQFAILDNKVILLLHPTLVPQCITSHQRSCEKVMLSVVSVCPQEGDPGDHLWVLFSYELLGNYRCSVIYHPHHNKWALTWK